MKYHIKPSPTLLKAVSGTVLALALAGCSGVNGGIDDVYHATTHYEQHPITVTKGTVKMQVPAHSSRMTAAHEDAVIRFAQQAKDHEAGTVYIKRPKGSVSADVVAGRVTQLMAAEGVTTRVMKHATYGGHGPVIVSYKRHFASTNECGDWSEDLTVTFENTFPPNYGCASQHNLAAMVVNPKDFVQPRTSAPSDATRRAGVIDDYRKGNTTAAAVDSTADVKVSDAVQ
ncbi:MAG: CpaD family pilus assembly lipoprotein [Rhizobiales bacterium]|nr:CpaD family pilus assembly lipoprotein [Hyphomicrobiales bacterium]